MQRKIDKRNVYNAGKGKTDEEFVNLHMSNHYRRILNAKKAIDNSPPYCHKDRRPTPGKPLGTKGKTNRAFDSLPLTDRSVSTNSNKSGWGAESYTGSRYHARCFIDGPVYEPSAKATYNNNMHLVDRITYDSKNGPAAYCDENWMEVKGQEPGFDVQRSRTETKSSANAKRRLPATGSTETAQKRKFTAQKKLKPSGATARAGKAFPPLEGKIYPKKTDAVSKLRSLRVYHPPRRKQPRSKPATPPDPLEAPSCKCTKICVCDASETVLKKISFNPKEQSLTSSRDSAYNGGVSSLPESRSPTPDQRRKKDCCCCCCCEKKGLESSKPTPSDAGSSGAPPPRAESPPKAKPEDRESFKQIQEDALYVKFIQDITTEILEKNLYTNKALKKVMKKHMKNNLRNLRKDRMLLEVDNLRIQLGIPVDKTLLELDGDICDSPKFYPVISDSEFVLAKSPDRKETPRETTSRRPGKPISGSETDEVISVTHVKAAREKTTAHSSSDSDRPSKKRSVLKNRKYSRTYSSSSSDSERSGRFGRPVREKCEVTSKKTYLGDFGQTSLFMAKKNRSVSFWKTPDRKQKSGEDPLLRVSRDKDKNV